MCREARTGVCRRTGKMEHNAYFSLSSLKELSLLDFVMWLHRVRRECGGRQTRKGGGVSVKVERGQLRAVGHEWVRGHTSPHLAGQ